MADLTTKERQRLPKNRFGLPRQRKYPLSDEAHARNALARVSQFGTPAEKAAVRRRVHELYPDIEIGR